jgi:predicted Ser/Thr protein kinase
MAGPTPQRGDHLAGQTPPETPGAGEPPTHKLPPLAETQSAPVRSGSGSSSSAPSSALRHGRFVPGTVLAGRYRIIELLGGGGMGEVYRADDLVLSQIVALKFLTRTAGADVTSRLQMYNEVRVARQVSHPNVCRVYDVGEIDGLPFICMEYIDGENLSSLLKRIGRLPPDKGAELARQICFGLAAIHDAGILHCDLKPANVMIDGRGRARITDFGLAGVAEELAGSGGRSGTPAYMAPEQIAGRGVTPQSDIYALGLVLYETFTGKRAFNASSWAEMQRLHETQTPTRPTQLTPDVDPAIERLILRCLEKSPAQRPPSVLAVAAALPGGDPLAAALAAGETPSPDMVAAAGACENVCVSRGLTLLGVVLAGLLLVAFAAGRVNLYGYVPLPLSAEVLTFNIRQLLVQIGVHAPTANVPGAAQARDHACGFAEAEDYVRWLGARSDAVDRWEPLRQASPSGQLSPSGMYFWYRESPRPLLAMATIGRVTEDVPPDNETGMVAVRVTPQGRLRQLVVVPPPLRPAPDTAAVEPAAPANWTPLLAAAGLMPETLRPTEPVVVPPVFCDEHVAWEGAFPGQPDIPLRVEAGALAGQPVYFAVLGPWQLTGAYRAPPGRYRLESTTANLFVWLSLISIVGGAVLAWRNVRLGRGDRRGSWRLAAYILVVSVAHWLLMTHHALPMGYEWALLMLGVGVALFMAGWTWLLYMGLEPYVRRWWPDTLIAWSRLLAGRWRDPLVGRDVLYGAILGVGTSLLQVLLHLSPHWTGLPPARPMSVPLESLEGVRYAVCALLATQVGACVWPMLAIVLMLLVRMATRSTTTAIVVVGLALAVLHPFGHHHTDRVGMAVDLVFNLLLVAGWLVVLVRYGLLVCAAGLVFSRTLAASVLTLDLTVWYSGPALAVLLVLAALAAHAFIVSLAGRPVLRDALDG